jgi:CRISPR/Cas system Type II protein with McrA/HNH and RuvC-like nuclease domain
VTPGLNRLSHAINAARQLTQNLRGIELDADTADKVVERLREAARLVKGKPTFQKVGTSKPSKRTRRRQLWKQDPHCFWCGRETDITTANAEDSATVEHIYPRNHPRRRDTRKVLPSTVLACARCNHERGTPATTTYRTCPVLLMMKGDEKAA